LIESLSHVVQNAFGLRRTQRIGVEAFKSKCFGVKRAEIDSSKAIGVVRSHDDHAACAVRPHGENLIVEKRFEASAVNANVDLVVKVEFGNGITDRIS
jgi:hypothetical protein